MQKKITFEELQEIIGDKKVAFWGASLWLEELLKAETYILPNVLAIVDKDPQKQGKIFHGYKIIAPSELYKIDADSVLLTIEKNHISIYNQLLTEIKQYPQQLLPNMFQISSEDLLAFETQNAHIFHNLVNNSNWCFRRDFIPIKAAANYSLLCILYIVLDYFKPQKILELGLGQTSKLTSQYAQNKCKSAIVNIIEHDQEWIEYFSSQFKTSANVKVIKKDIIEFELNGVPSKKYEDLSDVVQDDKYNLILIDGPFGKDLKYPRTNILDLIPNNLADDFIIILDDVQRPGEMNTAKLLSKLLNANGIKYHKKFRYGLKTQCILASESCKFVTIY